MIPDPVRRDPAAEPAGRAAPTLLARMLEDVVRVYRTIAALALLYLGALAGSCLLVALAFLLHTWLPWWMCFALSGVAAMTCGAIGYAAIGTASLSE